MARLRIQAVLWAVALPARPQRAVYERTAVRRASSAVVRHPFGSMTRAAKNMKRNVVRRYPTYSMAIPKANKATRASSNFLKLSRSGKKLLLSDFPLWLRAGMKTKRETKIKARPEKKGRNPGPGTPLLISPCCKAPTTKMPPRAIQIILLTRSRCFMFSCLLKQVFS